MTNYQKALLQRFKLIVAEAKKNSKSMALIPKFEEAIVKLDALNKDIDALQVKQEKDKTGITIDTTIVIKHLKDYMVDVSGALQSYAAEKKNNALLERIGFSENYIYHLSKKDILSVSTLIIEEAGKLSSEELLTHGISADDMAEMKRLQEAVAQDGQAPKHAQIESSGYTEQLAQKTNEAYELQKNALDKLATQFKRKDPDFYQKYMAASSVAVRKSSRKNGNGNESNVVVKKEETPVK
jgi:hypothetical protein